MTDRSSNTTNSQAGGNAAIQALLQSLGNGGAQTLMDSINAGDNGASILTSFLNNSNLSPEQQSIIDLLVSLGNNEDTGHIIEGEALSDEYLADDYDDDTDYEDTQQNSNVYDIRQFRRELNDLRNVNDTLAAALGACPICWGGDDECHECEGEGYAGTYMPDVQLFNELVVPAIRRVRTKKRIRKMNPANKRG